MGLFDKAKEKILEADTQVSAKGTIDQSGNFLAGNTGRKKMHLGRSNLPPSRDVLRNRQSAGETHFACE